MSLTFNSKTSRDDLVDFLESEYHIDSGIPVHLYSVINAKLEWFNKSLAITDGDKATMFLEDDHTFKSYGFCGTMKLLSTLNQCGVGLRCVG